MAALTDEHKTFIVQHLAMYDTPSQVAAAVKEEFGIDVDRQLVQFYNPTIGPKPAKKWIAIFDATRAKFLDEVSETPIAIRAVRLRRLDRMATRLEDKKNIMGAAALMEQAAKDVGGMYTNRRELTGKDGTPLMPEMTDDEARARVVDLMREAAHRRALAERDKAPGRAAPKKKATAKRAAKEPAPA